MQLNIYEQMTQLLYGISINRFFSKEQANGKLVYFLFEFMSYDEIDADFLVGFSGRIKLWLNDENIYISEEPSEVVELFQCEINSKIKQGKNDLLVCIQVKFPECSEQEILAGLAIKLRLSDNDRANGKYLPYVISNMSTD